MDQEILTEIPSFLKQLARRVTRGFYQVEDSLIIDMLVRNTCMKEKDIEELLKFDLKLLRSRMATLKNEKLVQIRLRMETGLDGKAQKVNYYFINYKSLVNVVRYKLDHLGKRIETQARDATNRASFKCSNCMKSFTDLEAGELYDVVTNQFFCTFCKSTVEEDESAVPQKDSRKMLARFNEQLDPIFDLLRKAENIKLAPELLEPEPMRSPSDELNDNANNRNGRTGIWSGEATRSTGANDDTRIDIKIGDAIVAPQQERKERPVWMTESTIGDNETYSSASTSKQSAVDISYQDKESREDVMLMLLSNEKREGGSKKPLIPENESDEEESIPVFRQNGHHSSSAMEIDDVGVMDSDDDDDVVLVTVGHEKIPLSKITESDLQRMTPAEKEFYIKQYQDNFAEIYD